MDHTKYPRVFMPICLSPDSAQRELSFCKRFSHVDTAPVVRNVRDLVLAENLTPLQAQAVLVRAWVEIQTAGTLTSQISKSEFNQKSESQ